MEPTALSKFTNWHNNYGKPIRDWIVTPGLAATGIALTAHGIEQQKKHYEAEKEERERSKANEQMRMLAKQTRRKYTENLFFYDPYIEQQQRQDRNTGLLKAGALMVAGGAAFAGRKYIGAAAKDLIAKGLKKLPATAPAPADAASPPLKAMKDLVEQTGQKGVKIPTAPPKALEGPLRQLKRKEAKDLEALNKRKERMRGKKEVSGGYGSQWNRMETGNYGMSDVSYLIRLGEVYLLQNYDNPYPEPGKYYGSDVGKIRQKWAADPKKRLRQQVNRPLANSLEKNWNMPQKADSIRRENALI